MCEDAENYSTGDNVCYQLSSGQVIVYHDDGKYLVFSKSQELVVSRNFSGLLIMDPSILPTS